MLLAAAGDEPSLSSEAFDARAASDLFDVNAARHGDHDAFERIVRRYQQTIARRLLRFSRDPNVIEELTQETFVQAYTSLRTYRGDAPLAHWLHRIAVRTGYRFWKSSRRSRPVQLSEETPAPAAPTTDDTLATVLDALSPRDRLILTLLYLEGHSVAVSADLAGWSKPMVKVQAFRARARLRKLMEKADAGKAVRDE